MGDARTRRSICFDARTSIFAACTQRDRERFLVTVQKKDVAGVDAFCARLAQPQAPHYLHIPPPARCGARAAGVCEGGRAGLHPPGPAACVLVRLGWLVEQGLRRVRLW